MNSRRSVLIFGRGEAKGSGTGVNAEVTEEVAGGGTLPQGAR